MEQRLQAGQAGTPEETERNLFGGGMKSAWGEMETGPCVEEAGSPSAKDKERELFMAGVAETRSGSIGASVLDGGTDLRGEMDLEQVGCSEAKVDGDVELEAEPEAAADWKMDGGVGTGPLSSAATCRREEERRMEEDQVVDTEEVGMDTSEEGLSQGEELTQGCWHPVSETPDQRVDLWRTPVKTKDAGTAVSIDCRDCFQRAHTPKPSNLPLLG